MLLKKSIYLHFLVLNIGLSAFFIKASPVDAAIINVPFTWNL
jgi:hypothetical protein